MNIKALVTTTNYETLSIKSTLLKHPHPCMKHDLGGCIQSLLLMTFADLKSIGVFNTDF